MAETEKKPERTVEVELLADGWKSPLDGKDYGRGDHITMPEEHAKRLQRFGSVGPKGTIEKQEKAAAERNEAEARHQRYLTGLGEFESDDGEKGNPPIDSERRPASRPSR
jgi:hypothetical protein